MLNLSWWNTVADHISWLGHLIVNFVDYRKSHGLKNSHPASDSAAPCIKKIALKPTSRSLRADIAHLAVSTKEALTTEAALQLESELLVSSLFSLC